MSMEVFRKEVGFERGRCQKECLLSYSRQWLLHVWECLVTTKMCTAALLFSLYSTTIKTFPQYILILVLLKDAHCPVGSTAVLLIEISHPGMCDYIWMNSSNVWQLTTATTELAIAMLCLMLIAVDGLSMHTCIHMLWGGSDLWWRKVDG